MKEKLKTKLRRNMRIRTLSLLTVMSAVSLSAIAAAPTVSTEAKKAADMINADAPMQKNVGRAHESSRTKVAIQYSNGNRPNCISVPIRNAPSAGTDASFH